MLGSTFYQDTVYFKPTWYWNQLVTLTHIIAEVRFSGRYAV